MPQELIIITADFKVLLVDAELQNNFSSLSFTQRSIIVFKTSFLGTKHYEKIPQWLVNEIKEDNSKLSIKRSEFEKKLNVSFKLY